VSTCDSEPAFVCPRLQCFAEAILLPLLHLKEPSFMRMRAQGGSKRSDSLPPFFDGLIPLFLRRHRASTPYAPSKTKRCTEFTSRLNLRSRHAPPSPPRPRRNSPLSRKVRKRQARNNEDDGDKTMRIYFSYFHTLMSKRRPRLPIKKKRRKKQQQKNRCPVFGIMSVENFHPIPALAFSISSKGSPYAVKMNVIRKGKALARSLA